MKADHFSIFVYPFEHGLPPKGRDHFLARAWKAGWRSWICRLSGGQELLTLHDRLKGWFHAHTLYRKAKEPNDARECSEWLWAGLKPEDTLRLTYVFKNDQDTWDWEDDHYGESSVAFTNIFSPQEHEELLGKKIYL